MAAQSSAPSVAIIGDVHGHLQLAGCVLANWQDEFDARLEAAFICGDAVLNLCSRERAAVLITYQGPREVQRDHSSERLQFP